MKKKKFKLKKSINELVDDTLSLIHGDSKDHVNQNVSSKKTFDSRVQAQTQPFSWNRRLGFGSEFYPDAYFSISEEDNMSSKKTNIQDLAEDKVLKMVENILKKRSELRGIETPIKIPDFVEFKEKFPIVSKYTILLTDKIKNREDEIGDFGATIFNQIIDSLNIDQISSNLKKIIINKLNGITYNNEKL